MPQPVLSTQDLIPFADISALKAQAMVDDVLALSARVAPCLATTEDAGVIAAAKAILRGVVLRWHETGVSSYAAQTQGPPGYPVSPTRERRNLLWPSEIDALQELCGGSGTASVYTLSLAGPDPEPEISTW